MEKAIDMYWHPTSQPWFSGNDVGTGILAGSADPHGAIWVADMADMHEHLQDHQPMLESEAHDHVVELAAHIIETHNAWLDAKKDAFPPTAT
ncbi:hypothetical protein [uncultured Paraglaciecola sp.]|uniref:hypothetical protein n=1 Tax=uncultured Paraglaciecola sp. TaxID=1765024 RepID=UPI0026236F12|nr:hypothetical protein [uncultured Paraglaciecola sp.]